MSRVVMSAKAPSHAHAHAAGLIVFRVVEHFQYLLLQTSYGQHHWTPPKGHLDEGEDALTAARRETEEEAGLPADSYEILQGSTFPYILQYPVQGKPKKVEYWLARLKNPSTAIKLSDEHKDYRWVNLKSAKALTHHDNYQKLMDDVEEYLKKNVSK